LNQQTIAEKVSCTGIGLHSGAPASLSLHPARADSGVVFVRTDGDERIEIPARAAEVSSTERATTLGSGSASVGTVEHLLAALYGLGIDNVRIEVDGPEVPVLDGSAAPFVYLLRSAGVFQQRRARRVLEVLRPIEVSDGSRRISIEPARNFDVSYAVDFEHPAIRRQELELHPLDADVFEVEIAPARTFGFLAEVEAMWDAGYARGGSLENTVVLDDWRVMNREGLRFPDEFARHKVLDLMGDLALMGVFIQGHVRVERGGHSLHQQLVHAIAAQPDAWRMGSADLSDALRIAAAAR
jgi:UDP-3-O-[3-hydroxymyristoyl] N-acetylglucosamine deacetylase